MIDPHTAGPVRLQLGILGTPRIAPLAVIEPAKQIPEVQVSAVASRDRMRAERFAREQGIPRVHSSYRELLDDPTVGAVYIALPNSLHHDWVIDALRAGKHVLCEKPLAANAAQADRMADVARQTGRVLAEGMHYRYHPLASRVAEIVHGGRIGTIRRIVADVCIPLIPWRNPRYRYELGGGAMMDLGCYAVDGVRLIAGAEPQVVRAEARLFAKNVDRWMTAELMFQGGASARITCSIWSLEVPRGRVRVEGDAGELTVNGLFTAHPFHSLTLTAGGEKKSERLDGRGSTYLHQLRAFVAASGGGVPVIADAASAAATLRVIDSVYRQAGLSPRGQ